MAKKLSKFSLHPPTDKPKEGMRIRLISMVDDPNPVSPGTEGTIRLVDDTGTIHVRWDDGRQLGVIPGIDQYQLLESSSGGSAIKSAIKKTPSVVNKSMPKPTKVSSSVQSALKSSGIKTNSVSKNFKGIKDVKVEGETDTSWDELVNDEVEDKIKGGKADKLSIKDLAKKHKVSVDEIKKEIRIGVKIEKEHVGDDINKAKEIAMDHISEFSDYYSNKRYGVLASEKGLKKSKKEKLDHMSAGGGGTTTGSALGASGTYTGNAFAPGGILTRKIKEATMTTYGTFDDSIVKKNYDDTRRDAWADKNGDGWIFNDESFWENGEIVEPLAKIKTTWDDENLDVSKEWDKVQSKKSLKKEDLLRMVKNRLDETKKSIKVDLEKGDEILTGRFKNHKDTVKKIGKNKENQPTVNDKPMLKFKIPKLTPKKEVKEEEELDETTTFGSALGTSGTYVGPAFAAKKGHWRTAKKPIWPGGVIVQKDTNEGHLNPVNEVNSVKYNPKGKVVTIKKKCTKFPYCNQGAIDNPLNLSKTVKGSGTYVEENFLSDETIKNIKEVADKTGKPFNEVYKIVMNNLK